MRAEGRPEVSHRSYDVSDQALQADKQAYESTKNGFCLDISSTSSSTQQNAPSSKPPSPNATNNSHLEPPIQPSAPKLKIRHAHTKTPQYNYPHLEHNPPTSSAISNLLPNSRTHSPHLSSSRVLPHLVNLLEHGGNVYMNLLVSGRVIWVRKLFWSRIYRWVVLVWRWIGKYPRGSSRVGR